MSAINLSYSTGVYRTTATLTATLTSEGSGISGQTVIFQLDNSGVLSVLGTATTDAYGVATTTISLTADGTPTGIPLSAAQHTIRAAYNGDGEYYSTSGFAGLTVTDANSDLALTNSTGSYGGSATLSATLIQAGINEPAAGEPVTFSLGSPATQVGTATTNASGVATLTISLTADGTPTGTLLSAGTYNIAAAFAGDDTAYNASNSPTASLIVNAAPFISVSGAPAALNSSAGTASSSTSFNILGPYLTPGNVTVSAPAGFDVSADNSTWSASGGSITIAETGALSTPVYVRLDAADAANAQGNYSGNIVISGGGAATVNVSVPPGTVSTTINAITAGSDWSNAGTIAYTVTFGAPVTGLSASNFSLTTSGAVNGAGISSISSGTNSYTVTVNTGTGDGTIGLNLANSTGLPVISTTLPFTGGTTNIDKTPPTITVGAPSVSSIVDGDGSVTYSVTYADANFNTSTLSTSGITLNTTGTAGGTLGVTMNSATSYTITISGITGAGTLGITIAAGTASDLAGNLTPAGGPSATFTVISPVISITGTPLALSTRSGTASGATDIEISGTNLTPGNITVTAPAGFDVSADNETWTSAGGNYTIAETGTLSLRYLFIRLDAADVAGTYSGNVAISGGGATVNVSMPASSVSTTINSGAATSAYSNASSITFTVVFGTAITGLSTSNFSLTTTGTISGAAVSSVGSGTNSYTVTVNTGTGSGNISLNLANATGLPAITTPLPFRGGTTVVDKTPPTITIGAPSVSTMPDGGGSVTYSVTYADANFKTSSLTSANITLNKTGSASGAISSVTGSGTSYTVTVGSISGAGTLGISIAAGTATDQAGNTAPASSPSATFNVVQPIISTTGTPSALSTISGIASSSTSFNVSGVNLITGNLTVTAPAGFDISANNSTWGTSGGNFTIAETGTLSSTPVYLRLDAADAPGAYSGNVTISGGGAATINISTPASAVYTTINSITVNSAYSNASTITFAVTFGASITGLSTGNFSLTTTGTVSGASIASVSGSGAAYTVTVNTGTGNGTLGLNLANATGLTPGIGTTLPFTGGTTTVDKTPPTITISSPSVSSIADGAGSITFTVTYADANFSTSTLAPGNLTLNTTGTASGTVGLTGAGTSYTVTISNITGAGSLGISIAAGTASDLAGNLAPASGASATFNVVTPIISTSGTPSALGTTSGTASSSTSFNVSGANMEAGILVTPPTGFEVSTDNTIFSSTVTVGSSGAISSTLVYIRLAASDADNTYSGNIVLTSTGANTVNVSMPSSAVTTPVISASGTPSALSTTSGTASSSTSFNVSGANMEAGILVTPPTGFEVSTNNSTFSSAVTVGSSGAISSTPVYIRLSASDADNTYSGNIVLTSTGATTVDVSMPSSAVTTPVISTTGTPSALSTTSGTASASTSFNISGTNMEGGILVTPPTGFEVSTNNSTFSSTVTVGSLGTISSITIYIRLAASDGDNTYSGNIVLTSLGATAVDVSMPSSMVTTPVISTTGTPSALSTTSGTASSSTSFNISGVNMEAGILVTPPTGFEVSLNNSTFTNTVTANITGGGNKVYETQVYIRLKASDADNTYSGNIVLSSDGATTVDINMPSSSVTTPVIATAGMPSALSTASGTASSSTSFNVSGSNLTDNITVTAPAGFDVSLDNNSWSNSGGSQTITQSGGAISSTPVYIQLDASDAVNSYSGNVALTSGGAITVDKAVTGSVTAPSTTISSLSAVSNTLTGAASVQYIATFAASVSGLSSSDFTLNTSGSVSGVSISSVTGSGTSWTITVNTGSGDGTIQLELNNSGGISPTVSNTGFTGDTFTIDKTAPVVNIGAPSVSYANSSATISYTITWSDANLNTGSISLSPAQLQFGGSGYAVNLGNVSITGSGNTRTISISGVTGNGGMLFSIPPGTASDNAGNPAAASNTSTAVTIDNTAPVVVIGAPSSSITNVGGTVSYDVSFSDANFNNTAFNKNNVIVNATGSAKYGQVTTTQNSATDFTVTLSGNAGDGTLGISVQAGTSTDLAGNTDIGAGPSAAFTVDNTPPSTTTLTYTSNNTTNSGYAKVGDVITLAFAATKAIQTPSVSIAGHSVTATVTGINSYSASYTMTSGDTEGRIPFALSITDLAGNNSSYSDTGLGDELTFDKTAPVAAIGAPSATSVGNSGSATVTYTVTYADANFNTSNLSSAGISLNKTGTATGTVGVTGSGNSYTVTISGITGVGTLGINLGGGYATDLAGNTDIGAGPSATFSVQNSDATLSNIALSNGTLTPAFAGTTTSYTVPVGYGLSSINITPATHDPNATLTINGTTATSASATAVPLTVGANTITIVVTAQDGVTHKTYTITVNEVQSANDNLASLKTSAGLAQGTTVPSTLTESVVNSVTSLTVTPTVANPTSTVTVNGTAVTSGQPSGSINLNVGQNTITIVVTAQDTKQQTYTLTVTRAPSANDKLSNLVLSNGTISPAFGTATNYSDYVGNGVKLTVTPTTADPAATLTINGNTAQSGTATTIPLIAGNNTITIVVTAQDKTSTKTYTVVVNEARSPNNTLFSFKTSGGLAKGQTVPTILTENVISAVSGITVTPTTADANATVTVDNATVISGQPSASIPLSVGSNTITTVVTAQNGAQLTYTLTVIRAIPADNITYQPVGVQNFEPLLADEGINVHQGISPNGDGIDDYLQIDNISQYPENNLKIMNRNGLLVYEAKGYDNATKVFDGHSNKNGQMQLPGTYFYELDYTVNGVTKHKTGYLVLKY